MSLKLLHPIFALSSWMDPYKKYDLCHLSFGERAGFEGN